MRENREFLELLKQSRVNEAKTLENFRALSSKHEELQKNFDALQTNYQELLEKHAKSLQTCENLQQQLSDLRVASAAEKEIIAKKPEIIVAWTPPPEPLAEKEKQFPEKLSENRRSSTENLDKLIESLLLANQKSSKNSQFSSTSSAKQRSYSSHFRENPKSSAKISYDLSRRLDFCIASKKNHAFSGKNSRKL